MKMRHLASLAAGIAVLVGAWIALSGFGALEALLGRSLPGSASGGETERWAYAVLAVGRTAGAATAALGAVVLAVSWTRDRRTHGWASLLGAGFVFVVVLIQQVAIWESALGWILVGAMGLVTLGSGLLLRTPGRGQTTPRPA